MSSHVNSHLIGVLGFASALPSFFLFTTMNTWLYSNGYEKNVIGWIALLTSSYALKIFLSPFIYTISLGRLTQTFGTYKSWALIMQLCVSFSFFCVSFLAPTLGTVILFVTLLSFCGAYQDLIFEGYRVDCIAPEHRNAMAAVNSFGYRLGAWIVGFVPMVTAHYTTWSIAFFVLGVITLCCALYVNIYMENHSREPIKKNYTSMLKENCYFFWHKKSLWWIVSIILLYRTGDIFIRAMQNIFLLDKKFTLKDIAYFDKGVSIFLVFISASLVSFYMKKKGLLSAFFLWAGLQALVAIGLSLEQGNESFIAGLVMLNNYLSVWGAACYMSYISTLSYHAPSAAVSYALLSSVGSILRSVITWSSAMCAEHTTWPVFFTMCAAMTLLFFVVIWCFRRTVHAKMFH